MIDFWTIIEIIAFTLLMIPYILASFGKWKGNSYKFIGFNVIGGLTMMCYSMHLENPILITLNLICSIGGIIQMIRRWRKYVQ